MTTLATGVYVKGKVVWSQMLPTKSDSLPEILVEMRQAFADGADRLSLVCGDDFMLDVCQDGAGFLRLFGNRVGQR